MFFSYICGQIENYEKYTTSLRNDYVPLPAAGTNQTAG